MFVHVINLPHREDRRESIIAQAKEQGFDIRFWPGVIEKPTGLGIAKAHRQIISFAKQINLPSVTVMEDDCIFSAEDSFQYYLSQKPKSFDLYFGMIYAGQLKGNRIMNGFSGMTLYTVHQRFYDFFLTCDLPLNHIDRGLGNHCFEKEYYVCQPMICWQNGSYSDNKKHIPVYNAYYEGKEFYKNRPPTDPYYGGDESIRIKL